MGTVISNVRVNAKTGEVTTEYSEIADPTPEELALQAAEATARLVKELVFSIQTHLDTVASGRGYDSLLSCTSYANSTVDRFAAEAAAAIRWRDAVWLEANRIMESVQAGELAVPDTQELIAMLPVMVWP